MPPPRSTSLLPILKTALIGVLFWGSVTPAFARVDLTAYGLQEYELTAKCIIRRLPSGAGVYVASLYWSANVPTKKGCVPPGQAMNEIDTLNGREQFLRAYNGCLNLAETTDYDPYLRHIADAVAVLAAEGVYDGDGTNLLDKLNAGSNQCNPPYAARKKTYMAQPGAVLGTFVPSRDPRPSFGFKEGEDVP